MDGNCEVQLVNDEVNDVAEFPPRIRVTEGLIISTSCMLIRIFK